MKEFDWDLIPEKDIIFVCCDQKYFIKYGKSLINSCLMYNNVIHVHIMDCEDLSLVKQKPNCSITFENVKDRNHSIVDTYSNINFTEAQVEYACGRFLYLFDVLQKANSVLVIDIDAVIRKPVIFPDTDYSFFIREGKPIGKNIAAGAVFMKNNAIEIADFLKTSIQTKKKRWFADQFALNETYQHFINSKYIFSRISNSLIDYDFNENSMIWTGKGPRKYNNKKYLSEVEKYK